MLVYNPTAAAMWLRPPPLALLKLGWAVRSGGVSNLDPSAAAATAWVSEGWAASLADLPHDAVSAARSGFEEEYVSTTKPPPLNKAQRGE